MSEKESLHGLGCPNCGGMIPIPEGQTIVQCPYCDLRSFVRGERGLRRYQTPLRVDRKKVISALHKFLTSKKAIARDAPKRAKLNEAFVVYLPFWAVWARVAAWVFGEEKVGSGDNRRYEPREVRVVQEMTWNGAACDVGEFGVNRIPPVKQGLEPFDPDVLHNAGMVFEPVNSASEAKGAAENQFQEQVRQKAGLDRLGQVFIRMMRERIGLVYHPLWILRYLYRERSFQVVVDGATGNVLYGKAPGDTIYRAMVLVLGMAVGAFLAIDVPSLILWAFVKIDVEFEVLILALVAFVVGLGIMYRAYRAFRYGEQYEYRYGDKSSLHKVPGLDGPLESGMLFVKDVEEWTSQLT